MAPWPINSWPTSSNNCRRHGSLTWLDQLTGRQDGIGLLLSGYLFLVLIVVPILTWRAAASGLILRTPRLAIYRSGMATSWLMALLGAAILWWDQSLTPGHVGLVGLSAGPLLGHTLGTMAAILAAGLGIVALRRSLNRPESLEVAHLLPRTGQERWLFAGVSVTAGLTEEFVFRGVAITALATLPAFDSPAGVWLAAVLVSVSFGLGHGYQEALGMLRAASLGFLLCIPFIFTGSLLPGMIAHTLADLMAILPSTRRFIAGTLPEQELEEHQQGEAEPPPDPAGTIRIDPAGTTPVDPASTVQIDPARTVQVDPAETELDGSPEPPSNPDDKRPA